MAVLVPLSTNPVYHRQKPHVGGFVRIYDAGTNTPRASYKDASLTVLWDANNIRTDENGCIPVIFVQGGAYKVKITSSAGVSIREIDNLPGDASSSDSEGGSGGTTFATGSILSAYRTGALDGWVRCNGRSIGSAISSATELASDDTEALFLHLWTVDSGLTVSGGRGATAAADWSANKTIALPDMRLKGLFGLAGMGNTALSTSTLSFSKGSGDGLGSLTGSITATLAEENLPEHGHTLTIDAVGNHSHSASSGASGGHTPAGSLGNSGTHAHSASANNSGTHSHTVPGPTTYSAIAGGSSASGYWYGGGASSGVSSSEGSHTHSITVNAGGDHTHVLTMSAVADHTHTVTVGAGGGHTHTGSVSLTGDGEAFNVLNPACFITFYIKL
jgi:hypothetical protein